MKKYTSIALIVAFGAQAYAQGVTSTNPFSVRAGITWPSDSTIKDTQSKTGMTAGLDFNPTANPTATRKVPLLPTSFYLDYHKVSGHGLKTESWGIGAYVLSVYAPENPALKFNVGVGYYSVKATGVSSSWRLGGKAGVSYNFDKSFSVTAAYNMIGEKNGVKPSYLSLELGYKF